VSAIRPTVRGALKSWLKIPDLARASVVQKYEFAQLGVVDGASVPVGDGDGDGDEGDAGAEDIGFLREGEDRQV
jgi:hypothetical protein